MKNAGVSYKTSIHKLLPVGSGISMCSANFISFTWYRVSANPTTKVTRSFQVTSHHRTSYNKSNNESGQIMANKDTSWTISKNQHQEKCVAFRHVTFPSRPEALTGRPRTHDHPTWQLPDALYHGGEAPNGDALPWAWTHRGPKAWMNGSIWVYHMNMMISDDFWWWWLWFWLWWCVNHWTIQM